jgi:DNA-binding transcriptional ArsR family regulator
MNEKFLDMPEREQIELPAVLEALADPTRLEIVSILAADGERACGTLALPVGDSTRSHHLRVLRAAGVTATRVEGTRRLVSLRRADLDARFPGLLDSVVAGSRRERAAAR